MHASGAVRVAVPAILSRAEAGCRHRSLHALAAKSAFICDMDGVVYRGNNLIPGVKDVLDFFNREGE
jgi:hypothetical protein